MNGIFERHDRYNFEAKIDYTLDLGRRENKYFLSFYFFIPKSLKVTRKNYAKEDFYTDMYTYIRFRNPRFTLAEILDASNRRSPLWQIRSNIDILRNAVSSEVIDRKIVYELRMLGTILRTCLKAEVMALIRIMLAGRKNGFSDIDRRINDFMANIREFDRCFEVLGEELSVLDISRELKETYSFALDLISLDLQSNLTLLMEPYRKRKGKVSKKLSEEIISIIEAKKRQRSARESPLVRRPESTNEDFTYWESILKKYFQGVLYLEIRDKDIKEKALHFFYAVAAGVAMFLSLVLGFWIGGRFSNEFSMSFILALVFAYIVKDRTKDIIRNYSNRIIRMLLHDHKFEIIDPLTGENIGLVRESVHFSSPADLPPEVLRERISGHMTLIESQGKPEEIMVYQKEVVLDTRKISSLHTRHRDINDIIRFNIRKFIQYADDPFHFDKVWDQVSGKVRRLRCAKVYHLNLIIRLETVETAKEKKQVVFKHVRVILNQDGILRMAESP